MGLPSFLKFLSAKHASCIRYAPPPHCTRLYVDFNAIIHNAARECQDEGPITDAAVIAKTIQMTESLVERVSPKEGVLLAVDGLAPYSKMIQQRHRRYMSAWRQEQLGTQGAWDTNAITPGTAFMNELGRALQTVADAHENWELSDASEPGEGETKIFRALKSQPAAQGDICVVHGTDADLILRALLHMSYGYGPYIYVMRDLDRGRAMYIDIETFRQHVCAVMANGHAGILDYVFLLELVGNDFIPCLSYLNHKPFAVPFLVALYKELVVKNKQQLCSWADDGKPRIHWDTFGAVLHAIALQEDGRILTSHDHFVAMVPKGRANERERLDNICSWIKEPAEFDPHRPGWRYGYGKLLLGLDDPHGRDRYTACAPYLQGLHWMLTYYVCLDAPGGWGYPFGYSPTALDLDLFLQMTLERGELPSVMAGADKPFATDDPRFQLCVVLPPQSMALLPRELRSLMTDPEQECVAYYPWKFAFLTYLKQYFWEVYPLLPPIDVERLHAQFLARTTT
jgi:5'-3' exonuclease